MCSDCYLLQQMIENSHMILFLPRQWTAVAISNNSVYTPNSGYIILPHLLKQIKEMSYIFSVYTTLANCNAHNHMHSDLIIKHN